MPKKSTVNTIEKGVNQDNYPLYQPKGTARNIIGGSIINFDGNNFIYKSHNGNTSVFSIPNDSKRSSKYEVIGGRSYGDYLYLLSCNADDHWTFSGYHTESIDRTNNFGTSKNFLVFDATDLAFSDSDVNGQWKDKDWIYVERKDTSEIEYSNINGWHKIDKTNSDFGTNGKIVTYTIIDYSNPVTVNIAITYPKWGEIGRVRIPSNSQDESSYEYETIYVHRDLRFMIDFPVTDENMMKIMPETSTKERLYITDGAERPLAINISHKYLNNVFIGANLIDNHSISEFFASTSTYGGFIVDGEDLEAEYEPGDIIITQGATNSSSNDATLVLAAISYNTTSDKTYFYFYHSFTTEDPTSATFDKRHFKYRNRYMVIKGEVTINGTTYGPENPNGNIFEYDNNNSFSVSAGVKTIRYYPIETMYWTPETNFNELYAYHKPYSSSTSFNGNLKAGTYFISIKYEMKNEIDTPWLPLLGPIYLGREYVEEDKKIGSATYLDYHNYQGGKVGEGSGKALNIRLNNIDRNYDRVKFAATKVEENTNQITPPEVFAIEDIKDRKSTPLYSNDPGIEVSYDGNPNFGSVSPDEFFSFLSSIKKIISFEPIYNKNIIGNIEKRKGLGDWDPSPSISVNTYECPVDQHDDNSDGIFNYTVPHSKDHIDNNDNPTGSDDPKFQTGHKRLLSNYDDNEPLPYGVKMRVKGGVGNSLTWTRNNGNDNRTYYYNDVISRRKITDNGTLTSLNGSPGLQAVIVVRSFKGADVTTGNIEDGEHYYVESGTVTYDGTDYEEGEIFRGRNGISSFIGGSITHFHGNVIPIDQDFGDQKGMASGSQLKSYKYGETYRFGILAWKDGIPFFVRHAMDYELPTLKEHLDNGGKPFMNVNEYIDSVNSEIQDIEGDYENNLKRPRAATINHVGLKMDIDLTEIAEKVDGIQIVRTKRKKKSSGQALAYQVYLMNDDYNKLSDPIERYKPHGAWKYLDSLAVDVNYLTDCFVFVSPETFFQNGKGSNTPERISFRDIEKVRPICQLWNYFDGSSDPVASFSKSNGDGISGGIEYAANFIAKYYQDGYVYYNGSHVNSINDRFSIIDLFGFNYLLNGHRMPKPYPQEDPYFYADCLINSTWAGAGITMGGKFQKGVVATISGNIYSGQETQRGKFLVDLLINEDIDYGSKYNDEYFPVNQYLPLNDEVYKKNGNSWDFKGIEIWGGDVYSCVFPYQSVLIPDIRYAASFEGISISESYDNSTQLAKREKAGQDTGVFGFTHLFPMQCEINIPLRSGQSIGKDFPYFPNDDGESSPRKGSIINVNQPESFIIYDHYHYGDDAKVTYPGLPNDIGEETEFPDHEMWSLTKLSGEPYDSYRKFPVNNIKGLERSSGPIKKISKNGAFLFAWQVKSVSYTPVNERTTIPDPLAGSIQLGTSGVLDRYDQKSDFYGLQSTSAFVDTKHGFYWLDKWTGSLLKTVSANKFQEVTQVKGFQKLIRDKISDSNIQSYDHALRGDGVIMGYDPIREEILVTIRNSSKGDITLVYNEALQAFSGTYQWTPGIMMTHQGRALFSSMSPIRETIQERTDYDYRDILIDGQDYYICISAYTSGSPATDPSSDATHWKKIGSHGDVFVHQDTDSSKINKMYGVVYPEKFEIVVNADPAVQKVFDNYKLKGKFLDSNGNEMSIDKVEYLTEEQSASDPGSSLLFRKRAFINSFALDSSNSRLRGDWLIITFTRENDDGSDPTIAINEAQKIISLISEYRRSL